MVAFDTIRLLLVLALLGVCVDLLGYDSNGKMRTLKSPV